MDSYTADLRAATQLSLDTKIFRRHRLGIPQAKIAKRAGLIRTSLDYHLSKMAELPNPPNADLSIGFTFSQVAEKHACPVGPEDRTGGWTEPMVWSLALKIKKTLKDSRNLAGD